MRWCRGCSNHSEAKGCWYGSCYSEEHMPTFQSYILSGDSRRLCWAHTCTSSLRPSAALNQLQLSSKLFFFSGECQPEFEAPLQAHPSPRRRVTIDLDECAELWVSACNFLHRYAFETLTKRIFFSPPLPPTLLIYLRSLHYVIRREKISSSWLHSLL